jgi:hypothetical protein
MATEVRFKDANNKPVSRTFEVHDDVVSVSTPDGRVLKANVDDSMLSPETLAKVLLLQLHKE